MMNQSLLSLKLALRSAATANDLLTSALQRLKTEGMTNADEAAFNAAVNDFTCSAKAADYALIDAENLVVETKRVTLVKSWRNA